MRNELNKSEIKQVMLSIEQMEADLETNRLDLEAAYMDANDKGVPAKALRRIIKERNLDDKKAMMAQKEEEDYRILCDDVDHDFLSFDNTPLGAGANKDVLKVVKNGEEARIFRGQDGLLRVISKSRIKDVGEILDNELSAAVERVTGEIDRRTGDANLDNANADIAAIEALDKGAASREEYDNQNGSIQWNYDEAGDIIPFPKPDEPYEEPADKPAPDEPLPEAAEVEPGESGDVHSEATRRETMNAMGMIEVVPGDELILQPDVDLGKKHPAERVSATAMEDEKAERAAKRKARKIAKDAAAAAIPVDTPTESPVVKRSANGFFKPIPVVGPAPAEKKIEITSEQAGASIPAEAEAEAEEVKVQSISLDPRPEGPVDAEGFDEDGFQCGTIEDMSADQAGGQS